MMHATRVKPLETDLYQAVKAVLENAGYAVKGEICGCDIVGIKAGEPPLVVITELKLSFTLELLLQAVDRLRAADSVWLAVVASRSGRDRDRRVHRLCRLLGLGLMAVTLRTGHVAILAEPEPYRPRPNVKLRRRLLTEHGKRIGDTATGGSTRVKILTAYRQQALVCAGALRDGPQRPRDLKAIAPDAGKILRDNVYGWFQNVARGVYQLTESGHTALQTWSHAA